MNDTLKKDTNGNRVYAGTWLSKSLHRKFKAVCNKERYSVSKALETAVRKIVREGAL